MDHTTRPASTATSAEPRSGGGSEHRRDRAPGAGKTPSEDSTARSLGLPRRPGKRPCRTGNRLQAAGRQGLLERVLRTLRQVGGVRHFWLGARVLEARGPTAERHAPLQETRTWALERADSLEPAPRKTFIERQSVNADLLHGSRACSSAVGSRVHGRTPCFEATGCFGAARLAASMSGMGRFEPVASSRSSRSPAPTRPSPSGRPLTSAHRPCP